LIQDGTAVNWRSADWNTPVIVNADDFGYSAAINRAIVASFERGYTSSTTLMANMPGFEEACDLVHEHRLQGHIGMHFVLCEGRPLTEAMKRRLTFCSRDGVFCLTRQQRVLRLDLSEKACLADELRAQVRRLHDRNIVITHADSHRHMHEEWGILGVVMRVCREQRIPFVRLGRNCGPRRHPLKKLYRALVNRRIRKAGLAKTRYFGMLRDYEHLVSTREGLSSSDSVEIMIHPAYGADGELIDATNGESLASLCERAGLVGRGVSFSGQQWRS